MVGETENYVQRNQNSRSAKIKMGGRETLVTCATQFAFTSPTDTNHNYSQTKNKRNILLVKIIYFAATSIS